MERSTRKINVLRFQLLGLSALSSLGVLLPFQSLIPFVLQSLLIKYSQKTQVTKSRPSAIITELKILNCPSRPI